jgi:hypothetical protein
MAEIKSEADGLEHGSKKGKMGAKPKSTFKHKFATTHIHHFEGGHVVHHFSKPYEPGMKPDVSKVVPNGPGGEGDVDPLHDHLEAQLGAPNEGEAEVAPQASAVPAAPAV